MDPHGLSYFVFYASVLKILLEHVLQKENDMGSGKMGLHASIIKKEILRTGRRAEGNRKENSWERRYYEKQVNIIEILEELENMTKKESMIKNEERLYKQYPLTPPFPQKNDVS